MPGTSSLIKFSVLLFSFHKTLPVPAKAAYIFHPFVQLTLHAFLSVSIPHYQTHKFDCRNGRKRGDVIYKLHLFLLPTYEIFHRFPILKPDQVLLSARTIIIKGRLKYNALAIANFGFLHLKHLYHPHSHETIPDSTLYFAFNPIPHSTIVQAFHDSFLGIYRTSSYILSNWKCKHLKILKYS